MAGKAEVILNGYFRDLLLHEVGGLVKDRFKKGMSKTEANISWFLFQEKLVPTFPIMRLDRIFP